VPSGLNFPHGAEFRLEPINSQPVTENHTIDSLRIALQSPHHLFIVPYSNHLKSSGDVTEEFRLNHDGSKAKPLPTKLQVNFSTNSVWSVHEHADMHGLRETAESFVRHHKSDKLTRHTRAAPISEVTTNRTLVSCFVYFMNELVMQVSYLKFYCILRIWIILNKSATYLFFTETNLVLINSYQHFRAGVRFKHCNPFLSLDRPHELNCSPTVCARLLL
ncbi:hypothetical protein AHF37_02846, partial [Paragonimus kellicotti]